MTPHIRAAALTLASLLLIGCTPVIETRGYVADPSVESAIKVGQDTKASILDNLGDPSTQATFGGDVWYYISSRQKVVAFFNPIVTNRSILAIHFDKDGKVADIKHYGLHDGHVVAFESRTTPTRGREITFLEQLFNATPGVPLGNAGQEQTPGQQGPPSYP
jgi:outer membrane protein assembly factor BamE (lipoprotein component of BamABCDE complex)